MSICTPIVIKCETDDDNDDVIIVSTPSWDLFNRDLMCNVTKSCVAISDITLDTLLLDYNRAIKNSALAVNSKVLLQERMEKHLFLFHSYYLEQSLNFVPMHRYFELMEEILTKYISLQLEIVREIVGRDKLKEKYIMDVKSAAYRICKQLSTFLHHQEEHCTHVLLKVNPKDIIPIIPPKRDVIRDVLGIVYNHFMRMLPVPKNPTDAVFCRHYLLMQKWKEFYKPEERDAMDEFLLQRFNKECDYIENNETLRAILIPKFNVSGMDARLYAINPKTQAINCYFKYIRDLKSRQEEPPIIYNCNIDVCVDNSSSVFTRKEKKDEDFFKLYDSILKNYESNDVRRKELEEDFLRLSDDEDIKCCDDDELVILDDDLDYEVIHVQRKSSKKTSRSKNSMDSLLPITSFVDLVAQRKSKIDAGPSSTFSKKAEVNSITNSCSSTSQEICSSKEALSECHTESTIQFNEVGSLLSDKEEVVSSTGTLPCERLLSNTSQASKTTNPSEVSSEAGSDYKTISSVPVEISKITLHAPNTSCIITSKDAATSSNNDDTNEESTLKEVKSLHMCQAESQNIENEIIAKTNSKVSPSEKNAIIINQETQSKEDDLDKINNDVDLKLKANVEKKCVEVQVEEEELIPRLMNQKEEIATCQEFAIQTEEPNRTSTRESAVDTSDSHFQDVISETCEFLAFNDKTNLVLECSEVTINNVESNEDSNVINESASEEHKVVVLSNILLGNDVESLTCNEQIDYTTNEYLTVANENELLHSTTEDVSHLNFVIDNTAEDLPTKIDSTSSECAPSDMYCGSMDSSVYCVQFSSGPEDEEEEILNQTETIDTCYHLTVLIPSKDPEEKTDESYNLESIKTQEKETEKIEVSKCTTKNKRKAIEDTEKSNKKDKVQATITFKDYMDVGLFNKDNKQQKTTKETEPSQESGERINTGKVMYTSKETIKSPLLSDFSNFEKENYSEMPSSVTDANMDDIFSGPVVNRITNCKEQDFNCSSNSNDTFSLFGKLSDTTTKIPSVLSPASSTCSSTNVPIIGTGIGYQFKLAETNLDNEELKKSNILHEERNSNKVNKISDITLPKLRNDYIVLDDVIKPPVPIVKTEITQLPNTILSKPRPLETILKQPEDGGSKTHRKRKHSNKEMRVRFSSHISEKHYVTDLYLDTDDRFIPLKKPCMSDHMKQHVHYQLDHLGIPHEDDRLFNLIPCISLPNYTPSDVLKLYHEEVEGERLQKQEHERRKKELQEGSDRFLHNTTQSCILRKIYVEEKNEITSTSLPEATTIPDQNLGKLQQYRERVRVKDTLFENTGRPENFSTTTEQVSLTCSSYPEVNLENHKFCSKLDEDSFIHTTGFGYNRLQELLYTQNLQDNFSENASNCGDLLLKDNFESALSPGKNNFSSEQTFPLPNDQVSRSVTGSNEFPDLSDIGLPCLDALNLSFSLPIKPTHVNEAEVRSEFSNSPKFLPDTDNLVQQCLSTEEKLQEIQPTILPLFSDNSNFYTGVADNIQSQSNPECNGDEHINIMNITNEDEFIKTMLKSFNDKRRPLKKRISAITRVKSDSEELKSENIDFKKSEISYPATPMISIAEVEALKSEYGNNASMQGPGSATNRVFKTPAERKEMPPLPPPQPLFYNVNSSEPSPIITDQFNINNHTYNNPIINYHVNGVPMMKMHCPTYYPMVNQPIILPFNNSSLPQQPQETSQAETYTQSSRESPGHNSHAPAKKTSSKRQHPCANNYYP